LVEQPFAADVADNERATLEAIDQNLEFIKMTHAVMIAPV
jgi:hypothetical protein